MSNSRQNSLLEPGGKLSKTSRDSRPQELVWKLPSRGGLTLLSDRKPAEHSSLSSSPRMVDHYKASRRAYNERKPTKTPKKKQERPHLNSPTLSSMTKNLTLRGDWSLTFACLGHGRGQPFSWAGGASDRALVLLPLGSCVQASFPGRPAHPPLLI